MLKPLNPLWLMENSGWHKRLGLATIVLWDVRIVVWSVDDMAMRIGDGSSLLYVCVLSYLPIPKLVFTVRLECWIDYIVYTLIQICIHKYRHICCNYNIPASPQMCYP